VHYRVTLRGADGAIAEFTGEAGRSIVHAASNAGYELTTGCRQGRCAICRARVIEGAVKPIRRPSKNALGSPADRKDGCVLLCSVGPASDVVLEPLSPWMEP
jgi:ferredoxin